MARTTVRLFGGVNEIGGNKFLVEEGDDAVFLDFGTSIGARNEFFEEFVNPRTASALRDLLRLHLLPDIDGIYREDLLSVARSDTDRDLPVSAEEWTRGNNGRARVHGVLLTHAHVDHFQDISFLDPTIPIHATATTAAMLAAIEDVKSASVESEIITIRDRRHPKGNSFLHVPRSIVAFEDGAVFDVGPFRVQAIPVDHSVPGATAFLVGTPSGKRILYTGDLRFHGSLHDRTRALLAAVDGLEPDLMLSEGTRMGNDRRDNESEVERGVARLVAETEGLVFTEFGWKDTTRFDTLQRVAEASGRTLLVDPRLAFLLKRLERRPDVPSQAIESYGNVRTYLRRKGALAYREQDYDKHEKGYNVAWGAKSMKAAKDDGDEGFLDDALAHFRRGARAADVRAHPERFMVHLTYWNSPELFDLDPPKGSRWIRCATEPYNAEMAMDLARQTRWMDHFGLDHNITGGSDGDATSGHLDGTTHVSGHAAGVDLADLITRVAPRRVAPIHTESKSLDRFVDLGFETCLFRNAGWRQASRGLCEIVLD